MFNNNNVCSEHPEEGLIEGRNVEMVRCCPSNLHEIYLRLEFKTLDAEEHQAGSEVVQS